MRVSSGLDGSQPRGLRARAQGRALVLALACWALLAGAAQAAPRPWPGTQTGVGVFDDQLAPGLTDAQARFAARRYAGTQKVTRAEADRLRAYNPRFLVLHYRLGIGLGYRTTGGDCSPDGEPIRIVEGNRWVEEWPGAAARDEWFFERDGSRVLERTWGWYLVDPDSASFRTWWQTEVARQLAANADDGVFLDSLSVPSYLGAWDWCPELSPYDESFERAWSARIDRWLAWLQTQPVGDSYLVPNVGSWITTRDATTYAAADGVMIEGFALPGSGETYPPGDWELQLERGRGLVAQGKAILAQTYAAAPAERMFALGTYLLLRGRHTYLNVETSAEPEWWPEYEVPIGRALAPASADAAGLWRRGFANAEALVNPTAGTVAVRFPGRRWLAVTSGGGPVSATGRTDARVRYRAVRSVTLGPARAVVVFTRRPRS